jgi:2-hydroxymuconate-semialdehyde hydrolase
MDALDIVQADVLANSFGGAVALGIAIRHPDRVRRLGLIDPLGPHFEVTAGLDAVWGYQPSPGAMMELLQFLSYDPSKVTPEAAQDRYEASVRPGAQEAFERMFPAPRQQALDAVSHADEDLASVAAPTLIVHGRADRVVPLSASLHLFELIDDAQLHVFGRAGHAPQVERPDELVALMTGFLRS